MNNRKNTKNCEINTGTKQFLRGKNTGGRLTLNSPKQGFGNWDILALEGVSCFQKGGYFKIL